MTSELVARSRKLAREYRATIPPEVAVLVLADAAVALTEAADALTASEARVAVLLEALQAVMALRDRGFTKAVAKSLGLEVQAAMSNTWIEIPYQRARAAIAQVTGASE